MRVHYNGQPSPNLFAAGELMAGNILGKGYLAGIGMTIGTSSGRIAGVHAAEAALAQGDDARTGPRTSPGANLRDTAAAEAA